MNGQKLLDHAFLDPNSIDDLSDAEFESLLAAADVDTDHVMAKARECLASDRAK